MNRVGLYTALVIKGIGWSRNKNKSRYTKLTNRSSKDNNCYWTKITLLKKVFEKILLTVHVKCVDECRWII